MNYAFHPEAAVEHEQQVAFYEQRKSGLGRRYHAALNAAVSRACAHPKRFKVVCEPSIRQVALQGFPFNLVYRENNGEAQVLAVAHHRRRPSYWAERI